MSIATRARASRPTRSSLRASAPPAPPPGKTVGPYAEPPGQLPVITQGNAALKPETSRNLNVGAVFAHTFGGNAFSVEADYHDIKVKNAISALDPNLALNNCAFLG